MAEGSQAKDVPSSADNASDGETKVLSLNIKTTKKKESIQVPINCTVTQVKTTGKFVS